MVVAAVACCALAGWASLSAAPRAEDSAAAAHRVALAVRAQRVTRTKQLEGQASREAALARLEAKVRDTCLFGAL